MLKAERQSARMSKITNDSLTRLYTGCFMAVPISGNSRRQRVKYLFVCEYLEYKT